MSSGSPRRRKPFPPAGGAAAGRRQRRPDGYQPMPQWLGQTRAPAPAKTAAFKVETFADGTNGAVVSVSCPTAGSSLGERNGRIESSARTARSRTRSAGMPADYGRGRSGPVHVQRDQRFATNRTIYFTYAVLPAGVDPAAQRSPAHVHGRQRAHLRRRRRASKT